MNEELQQYLHFLFEGQEGYVYAPVKTATGFEQKFFSWPDQAEPLQDWICTNDRVEGSHVYISPAVYSTQTATKPAVKSLQVCWVEFDGQEQIDFRDLETPSAIVQSSSSTHLHCYWKIPSSTGQVVEDVNRRLTYYLGADTSGWDCTQLLRPPSTTNRKHNLPVKLVGSDFALHTLEVFDVAPSIKTEPLTAVREGQLPEAKQVMSGRNLPTSLIKMIKLDEPQMGARSSFLTKLAYELAEEGLNHVEIVSLLHFADGRIGKFVGRSDRLHRLTQLAELAMFKVLAEDSIAVLSYEDILLRTKDLQWVLKPWLHESGLMMVSSAPNVGKTQFCLQLATCLQLSQDFLGKRFESSLQPCTLFMSLEMPEEGVKYIFSHQRKAVESIPMNFYILTEESSLTQYENVIEEVGATLVIVDSVSELMDLMEAENDNVKARLVLKWTKKIRRRYGCAVVLIHHNRKATEGNKKPKALNDLAGSFNFGRVSDTVIQLWEDREGIEVSLVKCRYGEKGIFDTVVRDSNSLWFNVKDSGNSNGPSSSGENVSNERGSVENVSNGNKPVQSDSSGNFGIDLGFS